MSFSNLHTPSAAKVVAGMVDVILILPILAQPLGITGIRPLPLSTESAQASVTATWSITDRLRRVGIFDALTLLGEFVEASVTANYNVVQQHVTQCSPGGLFQRLLQSLDPLHLFAYAPPEEDFCPGLCCIWWIRIISEGLFGFTFGTGIDTVQGIDPPVAKFSQGISFFDPRTNAAQTFLGFLVGRSLVETLLLMPGRGSI
jgi:hypothetical protein